MKNIIITLIVLGLLILAAGAYFTQRWYKREKKKVVDLDDEAHKQIEAAIQKKAAELKHALIQHKKSIRQYTKSKVKKLLKEAKQGKIDSTRK